MIVKMKIINMLLHQVGKHCITLVAVQDFLLGKHLAFLEKYYNKPLCYKILQPEVFKCMQKGFRKAMRKMEN